MFGSRLAKEITAYTAGEQSPGIRVKLNTNENPYPPAPGVLAAVRESRAANLYPDPACNALRKSLAALFECSADCIFVGNGSDEVLGFAFAALFNRGGKKILFPDITYSFYPVYCSLFGIPYRKVPLKDYRVNAADYTKGQAGGIVLANPNAPTGISLDTESIEKILAANPQTPVIIDEAYADFDNVTAVGLLSKYPNLVIIRTFSKSYSLAGARVGYALASPEIIGLITKIKDSFNSYSVNSFSQAAALAALSDRAYFERNIGRIVAERARSCEKLAGYGFTVLPSGANFLFVRHEKTAAERINEGLKERGIYVRHFPAPLTKDFLRITIGSGTDMDELFTGLAEIL